MTPTLTPNNTFRFADYFCGSGGSGSGLLEAAEALGLKPEGTFLNHWDKAINTHALNHPDHRHYNCDIGEIEVADLYPKGATVDWLWASPSCVFYSRARGAKPVKNQTRASAFCVITFLRRHNTLAGSVENVPEFLDWGPLRQKRCKVTGARLWETKIPHPGKKGGLKSIVTVEKPFGQEKGESWKSYLGRMEEAGYSQALEPDPKRRGETFRKWRRQLMREGYDFEWKIVKCDHYGDPTSRRRFFGRFVKRESGQRLLWPERTHHEPGEDGTVPEGCRRWRTARDIINWDDLGMSIFEREVNGKKALALNTRRRIAIGLAKYGLKGLAEAIEGFLLPQQAGGRPAKSLHEPVSTITTKGAEAVVTGQLHPFAVPSKGKNAKSIDEPIQTLTCESRGERLFSPAIIRMNGQSYAEDPDKPLSSQAGDPSHYVSSGAIIRMKGTSHAEDLEKPLSTTTTKQSHGVAEAVIKMKNTGTANAPDEPLHTVQAGGLHYAIMRAFLYAVELQDEEETILARAWGKDWKSKIPKVDYEQTNEKDAESEEIHQDSACETSSGDSGEAGRSDDDRRHVRVSGGLRPTSGEESLHPGVRENAGALIECSHGGCTTRRPHDPDKPVKSVTGKNNKGLAQFGIAIDHTGTKSAGVVDPDRPLTTQTTKQRHAKAEAYMVPFFGESEGQVPRSLSTHKPMPTVPASKIPAGLAQPFLVQFYSNGQQCPVDKPLATVTTKERHAVVYPMVRWQGKLFIVDVNFRMLDVPELSAAQGFKAAYKFVGTKTDQVKQIGNAVPRNTARALLLAHLKQKEDIRKEQYTYAA